MRPSSIATASIVAVVLVAGGAPGKAVASLESISTPPASAAPVPPTAAAVAAGAPAPPPRTESVDLYSRVRAATFVVGGKDAAGQQLGDIWEFSLATEGWKRVPLREPGLGKVVSATYSYRDERLWVLDEDPADASHETLRLLQVEIETGGSVVVVRSKAAEHRYDFRGLVTTMDGKTMLFASSRSRQRHRLAVLGSRMGGFIAQITHRRHRVLSTSPVIDLRGTLVFFEPGAPATVNAQDPADEPGPPPDGRTVAAGRVPEGAFAPVPLKEVEELLR